MNQFSKDIDFPSGKLVTKNLLDYPCTWNKMISVTIIHTAVRRQNTSALNSEIVEMNGFSSLIDYVHLPQSEDKNIQLLIVQFHGVHIMIA